MKWTTKEIELILSLIKVGKTYKEISIIVNRSETSIRSKLFNLGEKWTDYFSRTKSHICQQCGEEFTELNHIERKFCSKSCSTIFNNSKRGYKLKEVKQCLNCKKETKNKYCCNKCQGEYERKLIFEKIQNGDTTLYEKNYKNYLIHKYGEKCMKCGWSERHPITDKVPIQLEHKDGNSENNNLDNLELLCPNCHSLTETFGALNKGNGRKNRKR